MPVCLDRRLPDHYLPNRAIGSATKPKVRFHDSDARCLRIGILNNMPDKALQSTERQLATLLDTAADGIVVRLSLHALPDVPRSEPGRRHLNSYYSGVDKLWECHLDGLIVTGAEPRTADLRDEPYWDSLVKVLDWADRNTHSTILSCLSAHAALLHFDGIKRRRLEDKRFGVFECTRVSDHLLTSGAPRHFPIPQSRWNDIPANELTEQGYLSLTRIKDGGVDAFVKQRKSLFVSFQGHPEYEADTLFLEYRRDVGRYLRRETDTYPSLPVNYFGAEIAGALTAFQQRALSDRREELVAELPAVPMEARLGSPWRTAAVRVYGNWLAHLCAQKERRSSKARVSLNAMTSRAGS